MSYFYGRTDTKLDNHVEKRSRRKHSKQKATTGECSLESIRGSRHRRKHSFNTKGLSLVKVTAEDMLEPKLGKEALSSKCKTRRHLYKEIKRLMEENQLLSAKLEQNLAEQASQNVTETDGRDDLVTKVRNKYHKLEKNYNEVRTEYERLNAFLEQRESEYRQLHSHKEEIAALVKKLECERAEYTVANQKLITENLQLNEDIALLKSVIYRLNVELENYQDKLRFCGQTTELEKMPNENISRADEIKRVSESWGRVNLHALGPLLDAYQENLNEKEELIKQYKQEIDNFSGICKEIVNENELLHKEVQNLKAKRINSAEEMKKLEEDATIIKEENNLLMKQVSLQKQKLQEISSVYEQKVESMSQDNNKLHTEYLASKTALSNLQGKYEILKDGYEKLKNSSDKTMPVSVHTSSIDECKRLFEEVKSQYESEKKKLNTRLKILEETQPENEKQLITVMAERDQMKLQIKNLEKTLKHTRHKFEHLQNTVYSIQISRDSLKRQLSKITVYCEELVSEHEKLSAEKNRLTALLREREKESENIQHLGDNIAQRMGTLKSQLKIVQKGAEEQLATVEKQMKIQELSVDQMKTEYQRELQRLKHLVKQKEDIIRKLQKEKCTTQDNLELVWKAATSDDKKVKDALKNTKIYNI